MHDLTDKHIFFRKRMDIKQVFRFLKSYWETLHFPFFRIFFFDRARKYVNLMFLKMLTKDELD